MSAVRLLHKMDTPELSPGEKDRNWKKIEQSMTLAIATTGAVTSARPTTSIPATKGVVGLGASKVAVVAGLTSVVVATVVSVAVVRSSILSAPAAVPTIATAPVRTERVEAELPAPLEVLPPRASVAAPKIVSHRPPTIAPTGTLAEEVRLLAKAKASIAEGDRESARETLSLYRRSVAHPQLQPEAERLEAHANLMKNKVQAPDP